MRSDAVQSHTVESDGVHHVHVRHAVQVAVRVTTVTTCRTRVELGGDGAGGGVVTRTAVTVVAATRRRARRGAVDTERPHRAVL
jgi:hypothetical protein